jgi:clan AA aspartic protease (TIGR02281 family)
MKTLKQLLTLHIRLKYLVSLLLILLLSNKGYCQISSSELFEIIDLYVSEHYDVVKSKLNNLGFEMKESTPDYSNIKIDYSGDFMMMQPYECTDYSSPNKKTITNSYIKFKTKGDPSQKYIQIDFEVRMPNAQSAFQNKVSQLEKEIGPADNLAKEVNRMSAQFRDKKKYYGRDVEDPSSLIVIDYRTNYDLKYYTVKYFCSTEYTNFSGTIYYNLPKYPIENSDDYFRNKEANNRVISVPVKRLANTYLVEISIGGKNLIYIIDSGASEMFISASMEKNLLDLGVIRNSDYLPTKKFTLADGSEKIYRRVKIPTVRIGTIKIEDVEAAISDDNSPLLLGKSFLDKFKYWKVNNASLTIELQY